MTTKLRYCELCDAWVRTKACPRCGAQTTPAQIEQVGAVMTTNNVERTVLDYLRELESHMAAVEINVNAGCLPYSGVACARRIVADALAVSGEQVNPALPPIGEDDSDASLEAQPIVPAVESVVGDSNS